LLIKLKANQKKDAEQIEKEIFNLLNTEMQLRSKKELIEKFIRENMPVILDTDDIPQEFEKFWTVEQEKAFLKMVEEEKLSKEKTQKLIENYLYSEQEPMRDEILELMIGEKPTLLQRKTTGERILKRIINFVETFINGISG
jgi:type I restriction enzyme R subunit